MAKRVSIINFKGGVGKTMLAFHLATGIARYHDESKVLLIDVDHQSTLSILCLGGGKWDQQRSAGLTVDSIFRHFTEQRSLPGREIIFKDPFGNRARNRSKSYRSLDVVGATLELDDTEIELASASTGNPIRSEWEKRTLLCKWLDSTGVNEEYDYIVFDCPPATKLVTQNALAASHGYIIPVIPEAVIMRGVPHLRHLLSNRIETKLRTLAEFAAKSNFGTVTSYVDSTQLVGIAITRIQASGSLSGYTNDHMHHKTLMEQQWGADMVKPYILQGVGISESLRAGLPVYSRDYSYNVYSRGFVGLFRELTDNLKGRIDRL